MTMPNVTIVAKITAKTEFVEIVRNELLKLVAPTRKENGCIEYNLQRDNENPAVFIFYETWENPASLEKHMSSGHFNAYINAVEGLIEEKSVHKMTRIE
jgi:quinol monooxygenase YgiN